MNTIYRGWNTKKKEMVFGIFVGARGVFYYDKEIGDFSTTDDIIPMQYTGICDRYGNKIFYKDIIMNFITKEEKVINLDIIGRGCEPFIEVADNCWQNADEEDF